MVLLFEKIKHFFLKLCYNQADLPISDKWRFAPQNEALQWVVWKIYSGEQAFMKGVLTMSVFEHFRMLQNAGGGSQGALSSATGL